MTNLKLSGDTMDTSEPTALRFPVEAVRGLPRRARPRFANSAPLRLDLPGAVHGAVSSRELVSQIEATLDRMQGRLDDFSEQLARNLRIPGPGDGPPRAA